MNILQTRRRFLTRTSACLGMTAAASLLDPTLLSSSQEVLKAQGQPSLGFANSLQPQRLAFCPDETHVMDEMIGRAFQ